MKDLTQYKYACQFAMFEYLQGRYRRSQLISKLKEIENHYRNEINDYDMSNGFWFRFYEGDTLATTISNINHYLSYPESHPIYEDMIDKFDIAIKDASLKVYFS